MEPFRGVEEAVQAGEAAVVVLPAPSEAPPSEATAAAAALVASESGCGPDASTSRHMALHRLLLPMGVAKRSAQSYAAEVATVKRLRVE